MTLEAVDVHAHGLPPDGFAAIASIAGDVVPRTSATDDGPVLAFPDGRHSGPFRPGLFSAPERLADMERMGLSHQVVSPPPFTFFYDARPAVAAQIASFQNDALLEMSETQPESLSMLATLPMQDVGLACAEVRRVASFDGTRGVVVGSNIVGDDLDHDRFEPLWATLVDVDLPIFIHPPLNVAGEERLKGNFLRNLVGNPVDTTVAIARLILGGVLDRHPQLRVCLAHGGGFSPYQVGRWDHGWETRDDVGRDLSHRPSHYYARVYCDTITHDPRATRFLGERIGWDRVVLGTDYPFAMGTDGAVADLDQLGLGSEERLLVSSRNSRVLLRGPQ